MSSAEIVVFIRIRFALPQEFAPTDTFF